MHEKKQRSDIETKDQEMDLRKIVKDIEFLGCSRITWKKSKEMENKRIVSLGGMPPKKQRLPLSVAQVPMKRQKERELKLELERATLGRFGGKFSGPKRATEKQKPKGRVLKSSEGHFRNGVLDVKHLLHPATAGDSNPGTHMVTKRKKKGKGKKNHGKKKGGNRKHH